LGLMEFVNWKIVMIVLGIIKVIFVCGSECYLLSGGVCGGWKEKKCWEGMNDSDNDGICETTICSTRIHTARWNITLWNKMCII
jgi:hypothetical protein